MGQKRQLANYCRSNLLHVVTAVIAVKLWHVI